MLERALHFPGSIPSTARKKKMKREKRRGEERNKPPL